MSPRSQAKRTPSTIVAPRPRKTWYTVEWTWRWGCVRTPARRSWMVASGGGGRAGPVPRRRLVGAEVLYRPPQRGRGAVDRIAVGLGQARVDGGQHPAVAAPVDWHELAGDRGQAGQVLVAPQPGPGPGLGL